MVRRIRKSLWSRSFQRSLSALTRATFSAGTRAVARAQVAPAKPAAAAKKRLRAPAAATGRWVLGIAGSGSGARRYRLFKPPGALRSSPLPLLVMLHGCDQDAAGAARSTRLQALAAREGFLLLLPEQDRLANAHGCWNWFETRSGRAVAEASIILGAIDQACTLHGADPARVAIAGFSAGASMAAFVALHHPERFAAVAMHSGVAPGAAHSTATALSAMQGRRAPGALAVSASLPPLLVIQGRDDRVVRASNGHAAAQQWADAAGAQPHALRIVQRGARHAMSVTDYKLRGRVVATLCDIARLGHAWSGGAAREPYGDPKGPDASRMIWAFAARQFKRAGFVQSAAKQ